MKTVLKTMAALSLFAALISCKEEPKYKLTDGEWVMIAWQNDEGEEMMLTQNRPTLNFTDSARMNGFAGCNNFMGRYEVKEGEIKIDLGGMTMKMCMDMEIENRVVTIMPTVTRFKIDGNQLILYAGDKELFRFDNTVVKDGK